MSQIIYIDADRTGYSTGQVSSTMTIGELVNYLEQFDEDAKVYLRHDNGYTYGGITERSFEEEEEEGDEE